MKSKLSILMLLSILVSCTKTKKNDLEDNHLKGSIRKIVLNRYKAETKFGEIVKGEIQQHNISTFNTSGNNETGDNTWYYGSADSTEVHNSKFSFQYDEKGRNIKVIIITKPNEYTLKKYNGDLLIEFDDFESGKITSKTKYVYNSDDLLSEINRYDSNGKFTGKDKFSYNNEFVSVMENYKANGELNYRYTMTYDDNGNTLTEKQTSGEYPYSVSYKYLNLDNKGNWIKAVSYMNGKPDTYIERIITYQ